MAYYKTCPYCGASLDPGERCDCMDDTPNQSTERQENHRDNKESLKRSNA